jgi:diguanylate cyclase (GGDEF)-like protein
MTRGQKPMAAHSTGAVPRPVRAPHRVGVPTMPEPLLPPAVPLPPAPGEPVGGLEGWIEDWIDDAAQPDGAGSAGTPAAAVTADPAAERAVRATDPTQLPDQTARLAAPGHRIEPVLATALSAMAAAAVWVLGVPHDAALPLLALPAVALLSLISLAVRGVRLPRGGRLLRGLLLLVAAAAAGFAEPRLVPVALLVVVATVAAYPGMLAPAAGRAVTLGGIAALAVPLGGQLHGADVGASGDPLRELRAFVLTGADPVTGATRLGLVGGMAVVAVLGWAAAVNRRTLRAAASLAESRARDVRLATAEVARAASRDALTGLPNRDALLREVTLALSQAAGHATGPARRGVVVFAIDRFRTLVDGTGPAVADDVVHQLATRLRATASPDDVVARVGQHEFAVLLGGETAEDAATEAARGLATVLDVPVTAGERDLFVTCSVGVAVAAHGSSAHGISTAEDLLHAAEDAARAARHTTGARVVTSDHALRAATADRAHLEVELRDAVARRRIGLAYQPVLALGIDAEHDHVVAVEALARWTRDDGTVVPPRRFIPLADELGLGVTLGLRIVDEALDRLVAWRHAGYAVEQAWVNLAPSQLMDPEFAHMVSARLAARAVPATSLMVEIGAGTLVESEQTTSTLGMLRSLGVAIALDDFGRAGTSLTALRHLPITHVKLDHELAPDLARRGGVAFAAATLCRTLGMRVIAEGIETHAQLEGARAAGVDAVQGFAVAGLLGPQEVPPHLRPARPLHPA